MGEHQRKCGTENHNIRAESSGVPASRILISEWISIKECVRKYSPVCTAVCTVCVCPCYRLWEVEVEVEVIAEVQQHHD